MGCRPSKVVKAASSRPDQSQGLGRQSSKNAASTSSNTVGQNPLFERKASVRLRLLQAIKMTEKYMEDTPCRPITIILMDEVMEASPLDDQRNIEGVRYFLEDDNRDARQQLEEAARVVFKHHNLGMRQNWLRESCPYDPQTELRRELTAESKEQNKIIYNGKTLLVLAAPWHYLFCRELAILAESWSDGVAWQACLYLCQMLREKNANVITVQRIEGLLQKYSPPWSKRQSAAVRKRLPHLHQLLQHCGQHKFGIISTESSALSRLAGHSNVASTSHTNRQY